MTKPWYIYSQIMLVITINTKGGLNKMMKLPEFLKISYRDELFKLRPKPMTYEDLIDSLPNLIPKPPANPSFIYKDLFGDHIKIWNTKTLKTFYEDFSETQNLTIFLEANFDDLLTNITLISTKKNSEEDIINLMLLGIIQPNKDLFNSVRMAQTHFSKKIIEEVLGFANKYSIEDAADQFGVPWEVVFFMMNEPNIIVPSNKKKVVYNQYKNILRPSKCVNVVKEYLEGVVRKVEILEKFAISEETFGIWIKLFRKPADLAMETSHLSDKDKMKLVSCYLLGELSLKELDDKFKVTECQIDSWAINFAQEQKVYQRERVITAEEKYRVVERYLKGEYTPTQFQHDYGARGDLLYRWNKAVF